MKQKALLIAEKPSLRRSIEEVYNRHKSEIPYDITFMEQRGHLLTLKLPSEIDETQKHWSWDNLPFEPEEHGGWQYKIIQEKKVGSFKTAKERYAAIKAELKSGNYDFVIHAGDPDQEGELLVNIVLTSMKNKLPVKRFWSNDLTEDKVVEALKNLRDDQHDPMLVNLMQAAVGRQHSDYRFGMNVSEAVSLKMGTRAACGRVKTPILGIVCKREQEIKDFKPVTVYGVAAQYDEGFSGQLFDASVTAEDSDQDNSIVWYKTKTEAQDVADGLGNTATVISYETKRESKQAPKLFKLATAQITAGSKFGYSSAKTLEIIQGLYEKKFLSYPRTDCEYISSGEDLDDMLNSARAVPELNPFIDRISHADIERIRKSKRWVNDEKLKDSGHSALVPTTKGPNLDDLSEEEKNIYTMICRQFVAIFLPPQVTDKTTLVADIDGHTFKSTGHRLIDKGYTELLTASSKDAVIPEHKKGDTLNVSSFDIPEKTSTCPKRFTDAALIAACEAPAKFLSDPSLKSLGKRLKIGTPATRASIIEQLIKKDKYLQRKAEKKVQYIVPTADGMRIYEALKGYDICRVDMTGKWEELLEQVRSGEMTLPELEEVMKQGVAKQIEDIKNNTEITTTERSKKMERRVIGKCPVCGGDLMASEKGFYCSNWKAKGCKTGGPRKIRDSAFTDSEFLKMLAGETITKEIKNGDNTEVCKIRYNPDADYHFAFVRDTTKTSYACPNCGAPITDDGRCFTCTCGFKMWKTVSANHKMLTKQQIDSFFKTGDTGLVKGLQSKKGKSFDTHIVLSDDKMGTQFKFED